MGQKLTIELTNEQEAKIAKEYLAKKQIPASYSIAKAARLIGISESTIHRRIKDELIKVSTIGKSKRITQDEIDRYLNKLNNNAENPA